MKRKSVLTKQSVKRRHTRVFPKFWRLIRLMTSLALKLSILFICIFSLSLLFLYLYQSLITSPFLKLEEVIVTGVDEDIKQELVDMSGLSADLSLLEINLNEKKEKMERHPWVRSVELEKRLPHTLFIKVEKEIPRALVVIDELSYMNRWGKIFKEVGWAENKDYPVITGISKTGTRRDEQMRLAARVLDLFESEKGSWSLDDLAEVHINENGNVSLYSMSLATVIKIGSNELDAKKGEMKKIVSHLVKTGQMCMVKAIDLNYRDGAVVSFRKSG